MDQNVKFACNEYICNADLNKLSEIGCGYLNR